MNTIKNSEEKEQKRMNAEKGGAAVLWGVQKIKEKRKEARGLGLVLELGLGRFESG